MRRWLARGALCAIALLAGSAVAERMLDASWPVPVARIDAWPHSHEVLAKDGQSLRVTLSARGERRLPLDAQRVPPMLRAALIAGEDQRFLRHSGVDLLAVARATLANFVRGHVVSGASTLSMQLVRVLEPRPRTLRSKAVEVLRARQLERRIGKDGVLLAYANLAPLGGTLRGFESAARYWFGKGAAALDAPEAAMLVAMLPAPSRRAPDADRALLRDRRDRVLRRMAARGALDAPALADALARELPLEPHAWPFLAPHFVDDRLAQHASMQDGEHVIRTTLDLRLQTALEHALPLHGTAADGAAGVILELRDASRADAPFPTACHAPQESDGWIRALVGAPDWQRSKWNAAHARRSVGSTLKPFLYALALSDGVIGADSGVADVPARYADWTPANFDEGFLGMVPARDALTASRNLPAIELLRAVGVDRFADLLRELGLPLRAEAPGLDLALGTLEASPLELARAYARFADLDHTRLAGVADVQRTQVLRMLALDRPLPGLATHDGVAWKTGTSHARRDAWCVAVTARHVAVVWIGNLDGSAAADLTGARAALPVMARVVAALPELAGN